MEICEDANTIQNEIDMMFGGYEAGSGMLIPPFSFPQFDASDFTAQL
jgi:hypothetical protein